MQATWSVRSRRVRFTLLTLLSLASPPAAAAQSPAGDMASVGALVSDFVRVWSEGELPEVVALMADDVRVYDLGFTAIGRVEFERRAAEIPQRLQGVEIQASPDLLMSGNLAYATFTISAHNDTPSGPMQVWFRWSLVLRRVDGQWRVAHYHLSGDPDRPRAF